MISINEDPNRNDSYVYNLDPPYKKIIIDILTTKMKEIREVCGYN